jgi:precorrin-2 dehydrogenase/sirohydrochlorin ferrochelatase
LVVKYYPIYLNLEGKKCVVVGGGAVAERKVISLVEAEGEVEVISPEITPKLAEMKSLGVISHVEREYRPGDLKKAFLVVGATDDPEINSSIFREANSADTLVNIVDSPEDCNFIVPSVVRREDLLISISTSGSCPALAKKIREDLEKTYGPEYADFLKVLKGFRDQVVKRFKDPEQRKQALRRLLDSDALELLRAGETELLEERIKECMSL